MGMDDPCTWCCLFVLLVGLVICICFSPFPVLYLLSSLFTSLLYPLSHFTFVVCLRSSQASVFYGEGGLIMTYIKYIPITDWDSQLEYYV